MDARGFGSGVAPAVRQWVLWQDVWSGYGTGDSASVTADPFAGGVVPVLGVAAVLAGTLSRRRGTALAVLVGGLGTVGWTVATLGTLALLPTAYDALTPGAGLVPVGAAGACALGAVVLTLRSAAREPRTGSATMTDVSTPQPPSQPWNAPPPQGGQPGGQPGYGWGPAHGQQPWGPPPGQQPWGPPPGSPPRGAGTGPARTPVVLVTGVVAVVLMVVAAATGLYTFEINPELRQQFAVFTQGFRGGNAPTATYFRPESVTFLLGLMAWVSGAAVARVARHRVLGLAVAAAGAAVVLSYTVDFVTSQVYSAIAGQPGTTWQVGAYALVVLLLVAAGAVVLALVDLSRAARSGR